MSTVLMPLQGIVRAVSYVLLQRDSRAVEQVGQIFD
jgi:hypothetical protein